MPSQHQMRRRELSLLLVLMLLNAGFIIRVWTYTPQRFALMPIVMVPVWPRWTVNLNLKPTESSYMFPAPYEVVLPMDTVTVHAWIYDTGAKKLICHVTG